MNDGHILCPLHQALAPLLIGNFNWKTIFVLGQNLLAVSLCLHKK